MYTYGETICIYNNKSYQVFNEAKKWERNLNSSKTAGDDICQKFKQELVMPDIPNEYFYPNGVQV